MGSYLSRARTSHCLSGHLRAGDNIYLRPDGKGGDCRQCRAERSRRWIENPQNRQRRNKTRQNWYVSNPKKVFDSAQRSRWKRHYGITPEQYQVLLTQQRGICGMCGKTDGRYWLSVDHDHDTGRVRGLLCRRCNIALGYIQKYSELAQIYLTGDR